MIALAPYSVRKSNVNVLSHTVIHMAEGSHCWYVNSFLTFWCFSLVVAVTLPHIWRPQQSCD